ncbi:MAG: glycosyltransferase family 4 protein [Anaerolineales bacterium]
METLKCHGAQLSVLCFTCREYWQESIEGLGIPVIGLGHTRSRLGRLAQMIILLHRIAPDIVQSVHFYTNLYTVCTARFLGLKEVGAVRSDGVQDAAGTGAIAGQLSLKVPHFLAVNSKNAIRNIEKMGCTPSKLLYLPNVVDTQRFSPNTLPFKNEFHILMVGRLVATKRFDTFLSVLSILRQQGKLNIVGHIAGDGPDRGKLELLASNLHLGPEQVCFHGSVSDVENLYRHAHLCLHLSDLEGTPNTILEAMACGLPVIASRVGGVSDLVQNGQTGFLLEPGDESGLLTFIRQLMADEALRTSLGGSARAFIEQNYSLHRLPSILDTFYEVILG